MPRNKRSRQQAPLAFRIAVGGVLPALLILIGLHDVVTGQSLFNFSSAQFTEHIARYTLSEIAARVNGISAMGLGIGLGLRGLGGWLGRRSLPTDRLVAPLIVISVLLFLTAHWFLPGYVSLIGS